jgi:hypothetical protein
LTVEAKIVHRGRTPLVVEVESSTISDGPNGNSRLTHWLRRPRRLRRLSRRRGPCGSPRRCFLTSALVVVVLAVVGVLSLRAVGRLASVNREITTRTVPALRLATSTRDAVPQMVRLEARFLGRSRIRAS